MEWLRLWHDMPTDPKFRVVARRSGASLAEVMSVFVMMLTCASMATERGTLEGWDDEDAGAALEIEAESVAAIRQAMQGKLLDGDRLMGWDKRQPKREREEDHSTERVREYRARKATAPVGVTPDETPCNATKRHATPPDTDTETETETEGEFITTALDDRRLGSTPRVDTQHCGDPTEPGPREAEPVPVVTTPPPDTPPDSRPERLSVGRRRPGRESAKDLVESLLHEADADPLRRHWRGVLLAAERDADPERPDAWRLKVLRNWLAGDGAPPPPESRSERPAPGTLPAVPARASPSYPAPRLAAPRRLTPAEARDAEYRQRLADRHAARLQELEA